MSVRRQVFLFEVVETSSSSALHPGWSPPHSPSARSIPADFSSPSLVLEFFILLSHVSTTVKNTSHRRVLYICDFSKGVQCNVVVWKDISAPYQALELSQCPSYTRRWWTRCVCVTSPGPRGRCGPGGWIASVHFLLQLTLVYFRCVNKIIKSFQLIFTMS